MKQRVIKFRAWDGTFMINPYCDLREHNQFWGEDLTNTPYKSPISVMQFTGLHDKNGKEIYEGDIITYDLLEGLGLPERKGLKEVVRITPYGAISTYYTNISVIGNEFQNPELL